MTAHSLMLFFARFMLVVLFFPFSALDKILNFRGAVAQAREVTPEVLAPVLILLGLGIEVAMPLGILSGFADRVCALVLSGYCVLTALLWKQFWKPKDFFKHAGSKGRTLFWEFLKNISLAGGLLVFALTAQASLSSLIMHPFVSSHPYEQTDR